MRNATEAVAAATAIHDTGTYGAASAVDDSAGTGGERLVGSDMAAQPRTGGRTLPF
jgi:hypothetical protein